MAQLSILHPKHPERVCWGCEKFCPAADLACGNGSVRTPHPDEIFGSVDVDADAVDASGEDSGAANAGAVDAMDATAPKGSTEGG
jgi:Protein of unknown function (DUF3079)